MTNSKSMVTKNMFKLAEFRNLPKFVYKEKIIQWLMGISNYPQYDKYLKILPDMYWSVSCLQKKNSTLKSSLFFTQLQHFYMVARFYQNPPTESTNPPISTSDKLLKASSSLYLLHISWRSAIIYFQASGYVAFSWW